MRIFIVIFLILSTFDVQSQNQVSSISFDKSNNSISIISNGNKLLQIDSIKYNNVNATELRLLEESAQLWTIGLKFIAIPDFNRIDSYSDQNVKLTITKNLNYYHFTSDANWANDIRIYLKDLNDHYFGITENLSPDNSKSPDLRGKIVDFLVEGDGSRIYENYATATSAFFMCNNGYASFFNTFAKGRYSFAINGYTEIHHQTGNLDWYVFTGSDGDDIFQGYYSIIGEPKHLPLWACGPVVWRDENKEGSNEILNDAERFTNLKIPLTAMFVDRPYSSGTYGWSNMDFGNKFESPGVWIKKLNNYYGLEFMTWIGPCTFGDTVFPGLFQNYFGYFDLSNPHAIAEFSNRLNDGQYQFGVKGHKMDRADEHFPVAEPWFDKTPELERRNKYVYLYSKVVDSILVKKWGKDQFNFARSGMHGNQPYLSAIWGGDVRASWDGLASNIANAMRSSFIGFPVWGTDVGGYLGEAGFIPQELYSRWLQWGVWNGMYEIKIDGPGGNGLDRAPWQYDTTLQNRFRDACDERMSLVPYIYSLANSSAHNGALMKPLAYCYFNEAATYQIWDQYMFGNDIMVAPVYNTNKSRSIYFPEGRWVDFYDCSIVFEGLTRIDIPLTQQHIPVFIKSNGIYITGENLCMGNSKIWKANHEPSYQINLMVDFTLSENEFTLIDAMDNDSEKTIIVNASEGKTTIQIPSLTIESTLTIHLIKSNKINIKMNGKSIKYKKDGSNIYINLIKNHESHIEISLK